VACLSGSIILFAFAWAREKGKVMFKKAMSFAAVVTLLALVPLAAQSEGADRRVADLVSSGKLRAGEAR
jgi:hypothetical protein